MDPYYNIVFSSLGHRDTMMNWITDYLVSLCNAPVGQGNGQLALVCTEYMCVCACIRPLTMYQLRAGNKLHKRLKVDTSSEAR